jgi:hypothetical protein
MLRSRLFATCLLLSCAAAPALSLAQPNAATPASTDDAEALFQKGRELAKKKEWKGAYDAFLKSQKARPSHDTAANLGHVCYKLGKFAEGAGYLAFALRDMPTGVSPDKRASVDNTFTETKKEITTVHLRVEPPTAELFVDGESRGAASALLDPIFLMPGEHAIQALADGYATRTEPIIATKGAERTLELRLESATGSPGAETLPDRGLGGAGGGTQQGNGDPTHNGGAGAGGGSSTKTIVVIGGAALFVGAAVLTGVFAVQKGNAKSDAEDALDRARAQFGPAPCAANADSSVCREVADANDRKQSAGTRADIALVAAGVLGAGTLAALLLWPAEPASSASVRVTPSFSTNAAGAFVSGSF